MTETLSFWARRASGLLMTVWLGAWLYSFATTGDLLFVRGLWTRGPAFAVLELALIGLLAFHAADTVLASRDQLDGRSPRRRKGFAVAGFGALAVLVLHVPIVAGWWP